MKSRLRYYLLSTLFILSAAAFFLGADWAQVIENPYAFLFFIAIFIVGTFFHIDIGQNNLLTLNDAVGFAALLAYGATFGASVFALGMLIFTLVKRKFDFRRLVFLGIGITEVFIAGWLYFDVLGGSLGVTGGWSDVLYALLAGIVFWIVDRICAFAILESLGVEKIVRFFYKLKPFATSLPPLYIWGMALAFVFRESGYIFALVLIVPLLLIFAYFTSLKAYQDTLHETIFSLAKTIDARDSYTAKHSESVAVNSKLIARELGLSEEEVAAIYNISLLHDIGKVGIRDKILLKQGPLNDREWKIMREHPVIGAELVADLDFLAGSADAIKYHHERWDGTGYPEGLVGEEIPLWARIIAICDAWDAMCTDRPYRKALTVQEAILEIKKGSGSQFDPALVSIALQVFSGENSTSINPLKFNLNRN